MTFSDVRVVSYLDVIAWMKNPVALCTTPITTGGAAAKSKIIGQVNVIKNSVSVRMPKSGEYTVSRCTSNGKTVSDFIWTFVPANTQLTLPTSASDVYFVRIDDGVAAKIQPVVIR